MNAKPAICAIIPCLIVASWCSEAFEAYQQVKLGSALPKDSLLLRKGQQEDFGRGFVSRTFWPLPAMITFEGTSATAEEGGKVVARTYLRLTGGNWLAVVSLESTEIMEVLVPETAFRDPPLDWPKETLQSDAPPEPELFRALEALALEPRGRDGYHLFTHTSYDSPIAGQGRQVIVLSIAPRRVAPSVTEALKKAHDVPVVLGKDVLAGAVPARSSPRSAMDFLQRGANRYALKEYPQALADFDKAIELEPGNAQAYSCRAYVHASLKMYDKARADVKTSLARGGFVSQALVDSLEKPSD